MGSGSSYLLPEQIRRKEQGLCVDCGIELTKKELHDRTIRCFECRQKRKMRTAGEIQNEKRLAAKARAIKKQSEQPNTEPPQWVKQWSEAKLHELSTRILEHPARAWPVDRSKCSKCQWKTYAGAHHWFCPLPYCAYELHMDTEPANPLQTTVEQVR